MKPMPESLDEQITPDQEQERTVGQCVLGLPRALPAFGGFLGAWHLPALYVE
jgi:hypothetical protein